MDSRDTAGIALTEGLAPDNVLCELLVLCGLARAKIERGQLNRLPGETEMMAEARGYLQRHANDVAPDKMWGGQLLILIYSIVLFGTYCYFYYAVLPVSITWQFGAILLCFNILSTAEITAVDRYKKWLPSTLIYEQWLELLNEQARSQLDQPEKPHCFTDQWIEKTASKPIRLDMTSALKDLIQQLPSELADTRSWYFAFSLIKLPTYGYLFFIAHQIRSYSLENDPISHLYILFLGGAMLMPQIHNARANLDSILRYYLISRFCEQHLPAHDDAMEPATTE